MKSTYIPTGNELVSLPEVNEQNAAIESINFLHMGYKGIVELKGSPFMQPFVEVNGKRITLTRFSWERKCHWVPQFTAEAEGIKLSGTILAPVGERGFVYSLTLLTEESEADELYTFGLEGNWSGTVHTINESKPMQGEKFLYKSGWNDGYVFDFRHTVSVFSFAPMVDDELDVQQCCLEGDIARFTLAKKVHIQSNTSHTLHVYWGLGFEEVGATTAAKEMLRKGYDNLLRESSAWLEQREKRSGNDKLDELFNVNLFFNFFFASGVTLDTEQFVLVTSRSPRYYVSAAYWDRDSLLWSFPSILLTDPAYARNMLDYVFEVQIRNVGVHSRYIDGTILEPGFELDELCAPIIALYQYVKQTGDAEIVNEPTVSKGIDRILTVLRKKRHPHIALYETFLQPTDDMIVYPYLTYNNVLVVTMLRNLAELLLESRGEVFCDVLEEMAAETEKAIYDHCVYEFEGKPMFAWSVDLEGNWNLYDEPPGSLLLLPFYHFCAEDHPVYVNTMAQIRRPEYRFSFAGCNIAEIGCEHAPHPWILSMANSLLSGRKEHFLNMLPFLQMDNGIACESVDEHTGECRTGEAFATCAGFFAYALYKAFFEQQELKKV